LREQESKIRKLTVSKEDVERDRQLKVLPSVVRMVHNTFIAEKKAALPLDLLAQRLTHSASLSDKNKFNSAGK
jgi:hypothetical protein